MAPRTFALARQRHHQLVHPNVDSRTWHRLALLAIAAQPSYNVRRRKIVATVSAAALAKQLRADVGEHQVIPLTIPSLGVDGRHCWGLRRRWHCRRCGRLRPQRWNFTPASRNSRASPACGVMPSRKERGGRRRLLARLRLDLDRARQGEGTSLLSHEVIVDLLQCALQVLGAFVDSDLNV